MKPDANQIGIDVTRALAEDLGSGDVSASLLPVDLKVTATVFSRESLLLCGQAWFDGVMKRVDSATEISWVHPEGAFLPQGGILCRIEGLARSILTAERAALNFLQTLSATAKQTHLYVMALKDSATEVLDTRKTIPGLRYAQKYAVRCAGGKNHRFGLYDAFLIKENHIKAVGSIEKVVALARQSHQALPIILEVETLDELKQAFLAKPDRILLDNFSLTMIQDAVALNQEHGFKLEASGGIDLAQVVNLAATGIDYISVGSLTKSIAAIDLSLRIEDPLK